MRLDFRTLKAEEIECRVGQINENGFTLLLYKDARCDMNLLDEVCSKEDWQRDHKEVKGNLYCGVSIYDHEKQEWVTKWDCGTESYTEKEKGEASDSFKRACVNWGIGRELYTAPKIAIKGYVKTLKSGKLAPDFWSIRVTEIEYNENREICKLVIMGDKETIYTYGAGNGANSAPKPTETQSSIKSSTTTQKPSTSGFTCNKCKKEIEQKVKDYSEKHYGKPLCRDCQKYFSDIAKKAEEKGVKVQDTTNADDEDLPF